MSWSPEIQKADPRARRRALLILSGGLVIGLLLLGLVEWFRPAIEDWIARDPRRLPARLRLGFVALAVVAAGPSLALAVYLWRLGRRVVRAERFPPPELWMARDTVVAHGRAARVRGRAMQFLAAVVAVATVALLAALWRLVSLHASHAA